MPVAQPAPSPTVLDQARLCWRRAVIIALVLALPVGGLLGLYLLGQAWNTARVVRAAHKAGAGDCEGAIAECARRRIFPGTIFVRVPLRCWQVAAAAQCVEVALRNADRSNYAVARAAIDRAIRFDQTNRRISFVFDKINSVQRPTFIVPKDYPTISRAIEAAPERSIILISPGYYPESLRITKELTLIGEGPREGVIIENKSGPVLVVASPKAIVASVTLQGATGLPRGGREFGVQVDAGVLVLGDCDITGGSMACVVARGLNAVVAVQFSRIHDCKAGGGVCVIGGRGVVADCELTRNDRCAVQGIDGGEITVTHCAIYSGFHAGVLASYSGKAVVEDCEIRDNEQCQVMAESKGSVTLRRSRVHSSGDYAGLLFKGGSTGLVEDCFVAAPRHIAFHIEDGANPLIRKCKTNSRESVKVAKQGKGIFEDCEFVGAGLAAVISEEGGNPVVRRCHIRNGRNYGVVVGEGGNGLFEDCLIEENRCAAFEAHDGGVATLRRCKLNRNGVGAYVHDGAKASFIDCDLTENLCGPWQEFNSDLVKIEGGRTQKAGGR